MVFIINADDCGKTAKVNEHIETAILKGRITSTTIMANMDDFEGAVKLYKAYKDGISFGWHINLTEGEPLLYSQLLIDYGYYKEIDSKVVFNGKEFWSKILPKKIKAEIRKELRAQYEKLSDYGIEISHADSHQHIHTSPSMLTIIPSVLNEFKVNKVRGIRNYLPFSIGYVERELWRIYYKQRIRHSVMTEIFCSFKNYIDNPGLRDDHSIELMCHPGHEGDFYQTEEKLLMSEISPLGDRVQLMNYRDLK